jgi:hypothetical protein
MMRTLPPRNSEVTTTICDREGGYSVRTHVEALRTKSKSNSMAKCGRRRKAAAAPHAGG